MMEGYCSNQCKYFRTLFLVKAKYGNSIDLSLDFSKAAVMQNYLFFCQRLCGCTVIRYDHMKGPQHL